MIQIFSSLEGFPSIRDSQKISQERLTPSMMPPQDSDFYFHIINIREIIRNY